MGNRPPLSLPSADALHAKDKQHIRLTYILHFYFNKGTNSTLIELLRTYERYSPDLLDRIQFVIVDDGSPLKFEIPDFNLNLTWLRITDDIPWNLGGARNLGVVYAKSDKILLTDLDHEFPEHTLAHALRMRNTGRRMYRFYRKRRTSGEFSPLAHANSFLMSRARFLRLYGYDEEFCGAYGYFGGWLTQFHRYHGSWVLKLPHKYFCIKNDVAGPEADHDLKRDKSQNQQLYLRKRNEVDHWGAEAGHSRLFLNFRWEVAKEHSRTGTIQRRVGRAWKRRWWFRTLFGTHQ
jgi:hypothetical protein